MAPDQPWKAPALGSPIWMEIPATDVAKSKHRYEFYKAVFHWPFYETQPEGYNTEEVRLFEFSDPRMSGGIVHCERVNRGSRGSACVWWLVADLCETAEKIAVAGGRVISEVLEEGKNGLYRYFEDVDGNLGVAYQFVGKLAD